MADVIDRSLDGSLVFSLLRDETQVGMSRVVTDRAVFAWLCDVYVEPAHRGGIGTWMVERVLAHPDLAGVRMWLLQTSFSHSLYQRLGFTALPADPVEGHGPPRRGRPSDRLPQRSALSLSGSAMKYSTNSVHRPPHRRTQEVNRLKYRSRSEP